MSTSHDYIIDVNDETFEQDVLERSRKTLCIVDFWAEWCGPCRMLGPILEELAKEHRGKFTLVKINTEVAPKTAMNYGIQSIPAVFAFAGGEPIDGFAGVQPKEQIQQWLDKQLENLELQSALEMINSDPEAAIPKLQVLREKHPEESAIQIGLAGAFLETGQIEKSAELVTELEDRGFLEPEAEKIKAKIDLHSKSGLDIGATAEKARANPDDLEMQLEYANALLGHQRYQEGFEVCLAIVRRDKAGLGDQARELMVEVFRTLPNDSELTHEYRRKLSMALY